MPVKPVTMMVTVVLVLVKKYWLLRENLFYPNRNAPKVALTFLNIDYTNVLENWLDWSAIHFLEILVHSYEI